MRKNVYLAVLFATCVMLYGCPTYDPPFPEMSILNTGDDSLFFFLSCESDIAAPRDWIFPEYDKIKNGESLQEGYVEGSPELQRLGSQIESIITVRGSYRKPRLPDGNKVLHVFLFTKKTVDSYSWEAIKENNLFDKHLVFSEDSLIKLRWKLQISND